MTQKPKIQYIGQFYVHGSEARAAALKEKQKKARTVLPLAKLEQITEIRVEPVAVVSIVLAAALLVAMIVGTVGLYGELESYHAMAEYADRLNQENVALLEDFRGSYSLSEIEIRALALGMVPQDQVKTVTITLTPPAAAAEETWIDDLVWFFEGLFA